MRNRKTFSDLVQGDTVWRVNNHAGEITITLVKVNSIFLNRVILDSGDELYLRDTKSSVYCYDDECTWIVSFWSNQWYLIERVMRDEHLDETKALWILKQLRELEP